MKVLIMASASSHLAYTLLAAALLVLFLAIAPAMAAITLSGVKYMEVVAPGTTVTYSMTLSSAAADAADDYEATVIGFGNGPNGNYLGIDPAQDTGPYTARPFITLDKTAVHIAPGGKEVITATMQVPASGTGGRYALINLHPKAVAATGTGPSFTTAMNVPVMITLKDTQLTETGTIESVSAGDAVAGKPVQVETTLKNTGNHHYYGAFVDVSITDSTGKIVATASTNPSIFALIPGNEMIIKTSLASLPAGTYTVTSDAKFGTTLLDTKTASFTVGEPGAAVPTPTVSAAPTQAATGAPTAPTTVVTQGESPVTPGAIATRAPLSAITIMLALAAVSGILVLRRKG
jgi:hypothetical protein